MMLMSRKNQNEILECSHCGNRTPHAPVFEYLYPMLFDETDDQRYTEEYRWLGFSCATCGGLNLYGDFLKYPVNRDLARSRLYPRGFDLAPPGRVLSPGQPVPEGVMQLYEEVWPLRQRSPAAFTGQIKRLLLEICAEQQIGAGDFRTRIKHLLSVERCGLAGLESLHELVDAIGDMGESRPETQLTLSDVQSVDDFFRLVLELVYLIPARIRKLSRGVQVSSR